jgi:hypothetical protein
MTVGVTCSTCRYWELSADADKAPLFDDRPRGVCRRAAPRPRSDFDRIIADYLASIARHVSGQGGDDLYVIHESEAAAESYWPMTVADDWCGEYVVRSSR